MLPNFKKSFPKFKAKKPEDKFSSFTKEEIDLVMKMIALDPAKRITAR